MLLEDRIDYILGYPTEIVYLSKKMKRENEIVSIPVTEGYQKDRLGFAASTKTREGKLLIDKISRLLKTIRHEKRYRDIFEVWLDESSIESFRKDYRSIFLGFEKTADN